MTGLIEAGNSWLWKFRVLLRRNYTTYYRNPGNLAALLAPNYDIAFVLAAGYVAASILTGGFMVSFNSFYRHSTWLQWASLIKFTFQPLSMNVLRGTSVEFVIDYFPLSSPSTIMENFGCAFAIYLGLAITAYLALRYLHKERR
ncbi:abc transporter family protein [Nannochloropsis gaditana CCMP526]|uniref:abc transporter family protein n=1 Tax=Nannochloropsis gaditana (strain CCMP526) TaxID=1093141 RepID=UPI00029F5F79|nr:abc transporter family protein [Nannochloropsis gaditana CCMP526]EKU21532.1 abc transporter family protein [Nannochloropsis gaditana CCMP526]|eukprot:XP_005854830.1 abc transporter family protein [Nannochloropsis gaditana CCMP526]